MNTEQTQFDLTPLTDEQIAQLAENLTEQEREVILHRGTEPSFCGALLHNKEEGVYACKMCGLPLYHSGEKFESGTGWPSFTKPYDMHHLKFVDDHSHGMARTEICCARCGAHLGHVFPDGPPPTGHRYCMNSISLDFVPENQELKDKVQSLI